MDSICVNRDVKADISLAYGRDDVLNREAFVETLARVLVEPIIANGKCKGHRATGIVAGLTGSWGAGKSSVLNMLNENLGSRTGVVSVLFNPWLLGNRDVLLTEMFKAIRSQFLLSSVETIRTLATDVDRYWRAVDAAGYAAAIGIDVVASAGAATVAWSRLSKPVRSLFTPPPVDLESARLQLEAKINATDIAVVVLIDELDRVEDDEVREVARLIKAVGEIAGISYLVAYDPARVADALGRGSGGERRAAGEAYLEKIIQYPIPIRPLTRDDVDKLLGIMLDGHGTGRFASNDERRAGLFDLVVAAIRTPRDVKRLSGTFDTFWRVAGGEICPIDLFAYSWLAVRHPMIRDRVSQVPDRLVNDPTEAESFRRMGDGKDTRSASVRLNWGLPTIELSRDVEQLLGALFPTLNGVRDNDWRDQDRLSRRRNLDRILYMGDPPGQVVRSEVEALWQAADETTAWAIISRFREDGRLPRLLDRIDDLITMLPARGDPAVFMALSRLARRRSAFSTDDASGSISDIANTIAYLGRRDPAANQRIVDILDALIAVGDLAIVPDVLRTEMFALGLVNGHAARGGECLTLKQTEALWSIEQTRYRTAILDGSWLKDWASAEPMYALRNREMWDEELRAGLTAQLSNLAAFTAFATTILPPNTGMDSSEFRKLVDIEKVALIADTAQEWVAEKEPWVKESVARTGKLARSVNIIFGDDDD